MADIDFITDLSGNFEISLSENPKSVSGNRALLNRFELTFMTKRRAFDIGGNVVLDKFGGDATKFISVPRVIADEQGISAAISVAIDQTVDSLKGDDPGHLPDTERIDRAELLSLDVIGDVVTASIRVVPVEAESPGDLEFNLPITRRG